MVLFSSQLFVVATGTLGPIQFTWGKTEFECVGLIDF